MNRKYLLWLLPVLLTACGEKPQGPALFEEEAFTSEVDGKAVGLYTLTSPGVVLQATNFGGRVVGLWTRDRSGAWADIVVGHNNLADYVTPPGERFLGACVGPVANRIGGASFEVDGVPYRTPLNDNGKNTLHGGFIGVDNLVWDVVSASDTALVLHLLHPDGLEGYPGNLDITMTYALAGESDFTVRYEAVTDAPTPVNLTHHPFFCLRGEGSGSVEDYDMEIRASHFLPIDALSIPTGEIRPVEGTPFDFREPHRIGERIGADDEQLRNARGYDHNWCLDRRSPAGVEFACRVSDRVSGRVVEVWTDQPGMQFYSGNFFSGAENGSNGKPLAFRSSLALEAQRYPDAVNHPEFTPSLLRPGETYSQTTVYKFYSRPRKTAWAPAGDHIRTSWADEVSPSRVHPEYPRPQMVRSDWRSLNGLWKYALAPGDSSRPEVFEGDILVPFCIESSLSGVGRRVNPGQALWYETTFQVPRNWKQRVLLHFDAVDWQAEVWLNDRLVGSHTGGYTAFTFDITPYLGKGKQRLTVKVLDGTDNGEQPRGKQVSHPGGIWYTPVTGIWQSVWMEPVAEGYIADYNAVANLQTSELTVSATWEGAQPGDVVTVCLREGGEGFSTEEDVPGAVLSEGKAGEDGSVVLSVDTPELWSPEHPYLYALEFSLSRGGKVIDKALGYSAFRLSSEVRDAAGHRRIGLNGRPYFEFGPLDQGWWPDGLYTAPTDEALRFDIEKTRQWGFNMIRKHIKVEPARWYNWCDRLGIVVWQDMPSLAGNISGNPENPQWGQWGYDTGWDYPLTESAKATYYKEWGEIIAQLRKYPCIVVWVPFNEGWSQFDTEAAVSFTRKQDPTRLVNSASGGNSRHTGDILDSHNYPEPVMKFRSGGTQIDVLGEYGGIGFAVDGHLWQAEGSWGYKGLCANGEEVLSQYEAYAEQFIPFVRDGVSAGVYTQTTDVEVEVNGLMTYDRKVVKVDERRLREINRKIIASIHE